MKKLIAAILFLLPTLFVVGQNKEHVSWIENHIKEKVQIGADSVKEYSIFDRMKQHKVPGMSLAVVRNGKIVWTKGYGKANVITGTKVDEHTLFQAGSISKPVAALAVLKLVQQGRVNLDTDVNQYLKDWKIPKSKYTKKERVTLRRLLTHTAGTNVHGFPGYPLDQKVPNTIEVLNGEGNTPKVKVKATPGENWQYSGGGFTIMQLVVKDVSGMHLSDFMAKYIFPEIGMTESSYKHPISDEKAKIVSAAYKLDGAVYDSPWMNYPESAAAGLWTTATDLAKFCLFLQNGGKGGTISKELITEMLTPGKGNWGLGISMMGSGEQMRFGHGGKNAGFTNNMFGFLQKGDALIVLTNGDNGMNLIQEIEYAVSEFYDWNVYNYQVINPVERKNEEIANYVGSYMLEMGGRKTKIKATALDGHIILESKKLPSKLNLTPVSESGFVEIDRGMRIEFKTSEEGKVTHFVFNERWNAKKL